MLAPMIIGTDCASVIRPAETKPTSSTVVMVEEFSSAVIAAPASRPLKRLEVILHSTAGRLAPAMALRPSVSSCSPNRNSARPPASCASIATSFRSAVKGRPPRTLAACHLRVADGVGRQAHLLGFLLVDRQLDRLDVDHRIHRQHAVAHDDQDRVLEEFLDPELLGGGIGALLGKAVRALASVHE